MSLIEMQAKDAKIEWFQAENTAQQQRIMKLETECNNLRLAAAHGLEGFNDSMYVIEHIEQFIFDPHGAGERAIDRVTKSLRHRKTLIQSTIGNASIEPAPMPTEFRVIEIKRFAEVSEEVV